MPFPVLSFPYRVFYADTDAAGWVYYAQYLRMFEQARGLYCDHLGIPLRMMEDRGTVFVCRRAEVDYLIPARIDDCLDIETRIEEHGKAWLTFGYTITCEAHTQENGTRSPMITGRTKMACTRLRNGSARAARIPDWIWDALRVQDA